LLEGSPTLGGPETVTIVFIGHSRKGFRSPWKKEARIEQVESTWDKTSLPPFYRRKSERRTGVMAPQCGTTWPTEWKFDVLLFEHQWVVWLKQPEIKTERIA